MPHPLRAALLWPMVAGACAPAVPGAPGEGPAARLTPVSSADWTAQADQPFAYLGAAVAPAGDTDGDGFDDVVVGAIGWDGASTDAGVARVYLGSASGLDAAPAWTVEGSQGDERFGASVASAGDVDGDGYADLLVGAPDHDTTGAGDQGAAYLYRGSSSGPRRTAAWSDQGASVAAAFGEGVASAGDVNGDGYADVAVAAPRHSGARVRSGRVTVYLGSPGGLGRQPAWSAEGDAAEAWFGASVASAGDVNGDGYGDLVVGAPGHGERRDRAGAAYLYLGSATGLEATPSWSYTSDRLEAELGSSVAGAGDLNADGFDDLAVGAPYERDGDRNEGSVRVFFGAPDGPVARPSWVTHPDQPDVQLGWDLSSAGDVDGDGDDELFVAAAGWSSGEVHEGGALLFLGSPEGVGDVAAWSTESDQSAGSLRAVACAGDVDADGLADLLVGAEGYDRGEMDEGAAFLFLGRGQSSGIDAPGGTGPTGDTGTPTATTGPGPGGSGAPIGSSDRPEGQDGSGCSSTGAAPPGWPLLLVLAVAGAGRLGQPPRRASGDGGSTSSRRRRVRPASRERPSADSVSA